MWPVVTIFLLFLLQAPDFKADGIKALESQKYDAAAESFAKAIQADPKDYTAHFHLALAYSLVHKDAEAIAEYKKTLELKPDLYEAQLNLGILLLRQKEPAGAAPYLEAAVSQKPKQYRAQLFLGDALLATGDPAKAEQHYKTAAEIDPKSPDAQLGLGRSQAQQNSLADAAGHFRQAAQLDPTYKDALLELAGLFEKNKQSAEAIAIYEQFPDNVAAQERMGELLLESKRISEAIPALEKAVEKDPTPANRLALATAYRLNKEPQKALAQIEKASAAEPASYDLHMMYGRALRDERQFPAAAKEFLQAAKIKSDTKDVWNELAGVLYLMENYPQALAALDRVKTLGQEIPGDFYLRAITLDKLKQYQPALESYQQFLMASNGKNPDEEFKARQRVRIIRKELSKR